MKLILDQGLPRSCVPYLKKLGIDAVHVGELGMAAAEDAEILRHAQDNNLVVITLDADFHALLAKSGADRPSVIRIRREGLRGEELSELIKDVLQICSEEVEKGAVVSVTEMIVRIRRLPLIS